MKETSSPIEMGGQQKRGRRKKKLLQLGLILFSSLFLMLCLKWFCLEPFVIVGNSMEPTLHTGEVVLVNKLASWFGAFQRGEIIVFAYPKNPSQRLIKRIIALPGEEVEIKNGVVWINGKALKEPYILPSLTPRNFGPVWVPNHCFFVLGDNRNASLDSRKGWVVPEKNIVGIGSCTLFPSLRDL